MSARAPQSHDCTLSQVQVAARAGLSLRYQEYLERYPPRPAAAALRQLAAALRTTPTALLGAGANVPPGQRRLADMRFISKLVPAECRRPITPGGVGRIVFSTASGPVVVPVNFAVLARTIASLIAFALGGLTLLASVFGLTLRHHPEVTHETILAEGPKTLTA